MGLGSCRIATADNLEVVDQIIQLLLFRFAEDNLGRGKVLPGAALFAGSREGNNMGAYEMRIPAVRTQQAADG